MEAWMIQGKILQKMDRQDYTQQGMSVMGSGGSQSPWNRGRGGAAEKGSKVHFNASLPGRFRYADKFLGLRIRRNFYDLIYTPETCDGLNDPIKFEGKKCVNDENEFYPLGNYHDSEEESENGNEGDEESEEGGKEEDNKLISGYYPLARLERRYQGWSRSSVPRRPTLCQTLPSLRVWSAKHRCDNTNCLTSVTKVSLTKTTSPRPWSSCSKESSSDHSGCGTANSPSICASESSFGELHKTGDFTPANILFSNLFAMSTTTLSWSKGQINLSGNSSISAVTVDAELYDYLQALKSYIRSRPISWDEAILSRELSSDQVSLIKCIDKVRRNQRISVVDTSPQVYAHLFLGSSTQTGLLGIRHDDDTGILQYILVLLIDVIHDVPNFLSVLAQHPSPFVHLTPFLFNANQTVNHESQNENPLGLLASRLTCLILSEVLSSPNFPHDNIRNTLLVTFQYFSRLLHRNDPGYQDISMQAYTSLLSCPLSRKEFWNIQSTTLTPIFHYLETFVSANQPDRDTPFCKDVNTQLLYHMLLVIWRFSFDGEIYAEQLQDRYNFIKLYSQILRMADKDKILRLCLSTLVNLLPASLDNLLFIATMDGLPQIINNLSTRIHASDADVDGDVAILKSRLENCVSQNSTFSFYARELRSHHLRWSPPHKSESFWRDNVHRIVREDSGQLLEILASIINQSESSSPNSSAIAIACNDIAWIVKLAPDSRSKLDLLNVKSGLMNLLEHRDEAVRWESLHATGEWLRYRLT